MKIYTRTGDDGTTGLFGGGRVSKADLRVEAYGSVDELNSVLGVARAQLSERELGGSRLDALLAALQNELFVLGADLATPRSDKDRALIERIDDEAIARLESQIDELEADLSPLTAFILPGGSLPAATLHLARTVCRRAERVAVAAQGEGVALGPCAVRYLNRVSDLLFVMARWANHAQGVSDVPWRPRG